MTIPAAMVRLRIGPVPRKAPRKGPAATICEAARTVMYQTTRTVVSDPADFPYRLRISSDRVRPEVARMGLARAKRTIKVAAARATPERTARGRHRREDCRFSGGKEKKKKSPPGEPML